MMGKINLFAFKKIFTIAIQFVEKLLITMFSNYSQTFYFPLPLLSRMKRQPDSPTARQPDSPTARQPIFCLLLF